MVPGVVAAEAMKRHHAVPADQKKPTKKIVQVVATPPKKEEKDRVIVGVGDTPGRNIQSLGLFG